MMFSDQLGCWQSTIVVSTSRVLPLAPPATWVLVTTLFLSFALVSSLAFALLLFLINSYLAVLIQLPVTCSVNM